MAEPSPVHADEDLQAVLQPIGFFGRKQPSAIESCLSQIKFSIEELLAAEELRHQKEMAQLRASTLEVKPREQVSSHSSWTEESSSDTFAVASLEEAVPPERYDTSVDDTEVMQQVVHTASYSLGAHLSKASSSSAGLVDAGIGHEQSISQQSISQQLSKPHRILGSRLSYLPPPLAALFRESSPKRTSVDHKHSESLHSIKAMMQNAKEGSYAVLEQWDTVVSQLMDESNLRDSFNFDTYSSTETLFSQNECLPWHERCWRFVVVRPTSWKRLCWDTFSIFVVLYDIAMLPMIIYEFDETYVDRILFWFTLTFWTQDIVLSFFTGFQVEGNLEMRFQPIALRYLKGWFAIDMCTVLPDWVVLCLSSGQGSSHITRLGKAAKVLRVFRSLRLLRVFRLLRALNVLHEGLTNQYMVSILEFLKFVLLMLLMSHYSACAWYGISKTKGQDGWIYEFELHSKEPLYLYLTSMHWATSQLHGSMEVDPGTNIERAYAICYVVVSLIAASVFVSSITNLTLRMQKLRQETFLKTHKLLSYLEQNQISSDLTSRIQSFARHATDVSAMMVNQVELLKILPPALLTELGREIKTLASNTSYPLKKLGMLLPDGMRGNFLDVFHQIILSPGRHLFSSSEESGKMFILWRGKVMYQQNQGEEPKMNPEPSLTGSDFAVTKSRSMVDIKPSINFLQALSDVRNINVSVEGCRCIAEMSLWTSWKHRGDCIISGHPTIYSIDAQRLGDLLSATQNHNLHLKVNLALFIANYVEQYITWMRGESSDLLDDLSVCRLRRKRYRTGDRF